MVRQVYRCYLYFVCVALLATATSVTGSSLTTLLYSTSLRGTSYDPSSHSQGVQAVVSLVTVWIVALVFGGLHYWLIRRDMASDPEASRGAVRSFFLNVPQLIVALIAIGEFAAGIGYLGNPYNVAIGSLSGALAATGMFLVLQLERQRARVSTAAALAFQRLHLFGAQLGIVFIATAVFFQAAQNTVEVVLLSTGNPDYCAYYLSSDMCRPNANTPIGQSFTTNVNFPAGQLIAAWAAVFFIAACWAGYTASSRHDRHSRLRQVLHLLAFGVGLGLLLNGVERSLGIALRRVIDRPIPAIDIPGWLNLTAGMLLAGLVILLVYWALYARESPDLPSGVPAAGLIQQALVAVIFAYPFWFGLIALLSDGFERIVPAGVHPLAQDSVWSAATLLTGLPFVFFAFQLGVRARQTGVTWPHRIFVLIMLASGTVATATGLVLALQAVVSTLLGAPPQDWQTSARHGLVVILVGGAMVAIFGTLAMRSRYLAGKPQPAQETAPTATEPVTSAAPSAETLEGILDALLAGRITRDEAAARIRHSIPVS